MNQYFWADGAIFQPWPFLKYKMVIVVQYSFLETKQPLAMFTIQCMEGSNIEIYD